MVEKTYKDFKYYLYHPNSKIKGWYEFFIWLDTNEITNAFDSVMSFTFDGKHRRSKAEAEQRARKLIDDSYVNPHVKELFEG